LDVNGSIFDAINGLAGHATIADDAMKFAAEYVIFGVFALVVASWFVRSGNDESRRIAVYTAVLTGALSIAAVMVIQHFYVHQRPFVTRSDVVLLVKHSADASFPSEHATAAFALAAGIAVYRLRYGLLLAALAALISFARVYVGIHYPYDVLGGAAIGGGFALALRPARPAFAWLDRTIVLRIVPAALR
jgi:undecaprenyl-diphosphatase